MVGLAGESNASGDEQKKLDVIANDVFCQAVSDSGRTALLVSEEQDTPIALEATEGGNYLYAAESCALPPPTALPTGPHGQALRPLGF